MSKYDNHSTARLPLIESVIIIAIFALASVTIMQLYLSADRIQQKSVNISKATLLAENRIEDIKSGAVTKDSVEYFDSEWNRVDAGSKSADFYMNTEFVNTQKGATGTLDEIKVSVCTLDDTVLADIETFCYIK